MVDLTSLFQQAGGGGNMLDMAREASQINQIGLANQAASQQLRARMAMGPIMQRAIGEDGQVNWDKFLVGIASHPDTAFMAPEMADKAVQRQLTQTDTLRKQFDLAMDRQGAISQRMASLLSSGRPITKSTLLAEAYDARANDQISDQDLSAFQQRVVATPDGEALGALARQIGLNSKNAFDTMRLSQPNIEERLRRYDVVGPSGEKLSIPALAPGMGAPPAPGAPGGGGSAGGIPSPQSGAPQVGALPTALPPASAEQFKKFGDQYDKEREAAQDALNINNVITEMRGAQRKFQGGAGADVRQQLSRLAQALGIPEEQYNGVLARAGEEGKTGALAASQLFGKYALELAASRMRELLRGGGRFTNIEFKAFTDALPTISTDPHAVDEMLKFMERRNKLQIAYANDYGYAIKNKENPADFQNKWFQHMQEFQRLRQQELGLPQ